MDIEDVEKLDFVTKTVGSLSMLKSLFKRMGFAQIIDSICPLAPQADLSCGHVAEILVANRLRAPKPFYKIEKWAKEAGVEEVFGILPELLTDDKLGRRTEIFGENASVLKGEISLHIVEKLKIGLDVFHWDLTNIYFEGAYEEKEQKEATEHKEGIHIRYAKEGKENAKKAVKVGLDMANDGKGPVPVYYDPLDGNASGYKATIENMKNLKERLKIDKVIRITDRGCLSAKIIALSLSQGFHIISSITFSKGIKKRVKEALASGVEFNPLDYVPISQQKKDPSKRDGYMAFELPYEVKYNKGVYPLRLIVVKSDGKVRRNQKSRHKHMTRIEDRLNELKEKIGKPRWTKDRILKGIKKALKMYPEGKFYKVELLDDGKRPTELKIEVEVEKVKEEALLDGIYALVTTLPFEEHFTDKVFRLFKEQHYVERSNHILKGHLLVNAVYLKIPIRIEGLLFILWLALLAYLLIERMYRNNTKEPKQKRRTTRDIFESFEGYSWLFIKVSGGDYYPRPSPLTSDQKEIYEALELNPP